MQTAGCTCCARTQRVRNHGAEKATASRPQGRESKPPEQVHGQAVAEVSLALWAHATGAPAGRIGVSRSAQHRVRPLPMPPNAGQVVDLQIHVLPAREGGQQVCEDTGHAHAAHLTFQTPRHNSHGPAAGCGPKCGERLNECCQSHGVLLQHALHMCTVPPRMAFTGRPGRWLLCAPCWSRRSRAPCWPWWSKVTGIKHMVDGR